MQPDVAAARDSRLPVPLPGLVAAVAVVGLAVALARLPPLRTLLALNGVLAAVAVADWLAATRPRNVKVTRDVPLRIVAGEAAQLTWTVHNPTHRVLRLALADGVVPSLQCADRRARMTVPAGGRAQAHTTLRPVRRGRFPFAPLTVRVEGPLRLVARQGSHRLDATLVVLPRFASRGEAELRLRTARQLEAGLRATRGRGTGTEFDALRAYGPDDEFRHIDWAATARSRAPVVRTYRAERNQTLLVLLDTGRTMAGLVDGLPRLDRTMDAAMTVTVLAGGLGDRTALVAFDARVRALVRPGQARTQLRAMTEALTRLQPELVESDYRQAFAVTLSTFRRRALLVVLSELSAYAAAHTLVPAVPLVARRHEVIVAGVRDPELVAWAEATPRDAGGAYRKAAAVAALAERQRTAALLRRSGAEVVDEVPARLAGRVADAYLRAKATGRL